MASGTIQPKTPTQQYLRTCTLILANQSGAAVDLSQFRIKFSVKKSQVETPNMADIRVYNLEEQTALLIQREFTRVTFQAGYQANYGVIFQGNIKQIIIGRESATDTFINIIAGDGDEAYNFAIVTASVARGSTQQHQVDAAVQAMAKKGVVGGVTNIQFQQKLARGKVMYGNARNYLRSATDTANYTWSIQDEKVILIPKKSYLPGTAVELTSKTGMIGTPQQTNTGVNVKCLLNPNIPVGGRIKLDNSSIQEQTLNLEQISTLKGDVQAINKLIPRRLNPDGFYYVQVLEHSGDTRGVEWYTSMVCLDIDSSANPRNAVPVG